MARSWVRSGLVGAIVCVTLFDGCSSSSMPPANELTGMHFASTGTTDPPSPLPAVDVSVGQVPAQNIYNLTLALPDMPPGIYNCPLDIGIVDTLTFFDGDSPVVTATLDRGGCEVVRFSGSTEIRRVLDESYWVSLAQQLGIPESMISPVLQP